MNHEILHLKKSALRTFADEAKLMDDCINLTLGEPCFNTLDEIKACAKQAIDENYTHYALNSGILSLREKIVEHLYHDYNCQYDVNEILITNGASDGISTVLHALINENDEIIIPVPCYPQYESLIQICKGKMVILELDNDYEVSENVLKSLFNNHTKAVILTLPNNPTGKLLSHKSLSIIEQLCAINHIFLIIDHSYEQLIYDNHKSNVFNFPLINDHVIHVCSFSKGYAMTGWRCGYIAAHHSIMKSIHIYHQSHVCSVCTFVQIACEKALSLKYTEQLAYYQKQRDYAYQRTFNMGLNPVLPDGGFYLYLERNDSLNFAYELLNHAHVALLPGEFFHDENHLRLSFSCEYSDLKKGLDRLEEYLLLLKSCRKYVACGNSFVICKKTNLNKKIFALHICKVYKCDGCIYINDSLLTMEIYNKDGSSATMCGNGIRAAYHYCIDEKIILAADNVIGCNEISYPLYLKSLAPFSAEVNLGIPQFNPDLMKIETEKKHFIHQHIEVCQQDFMISCLYLSVKHGILLMDPCSDEIAEAICHYAKFKDDMNINFLKVMDASTLYVKTYERGVGWSASCGSGACAAFVYASMFGLCNKQVIIETDGGKLRAEIKPDGVYLCGESINDSEHMLINE